MPAALGLGLGLSSNWKKLQLSLPSDTATAGNGKPTTSLKRKRPDPAPIPLRRKERAAAVSSDMAPSVPALPPPPPPTSTRAPSSPPPPPPPPLLDTTAPRTLNTGRTGHPAGRYVSLDCEMVSTKLRGHSLARVSLTSYAHEVLYDAFVLPHPADPVVDYRTHVSGITPEVLRVGYARPFARVQREVADLLRGRVLVGHALANDLKVLELDHPAWALRDTSRHRRYRELAGGRTPGLKLLAWEVLGLRVQEGTHDSVVDARVAMELYRKAKPGMEGEARRRYGERAARVGSDGPVLGSAGGQRHEEKGEGTGAGDKHGKLSEGGGDGNGDGDEDGERSIKTKRKKKKKNRRGHKSRTTLA